MSGQNPIASSKTWRHRRTFLIATIGSAFSFGNISMFPYLVSQNGGGAFLLIYLLCVTIIGLPLFMAECAIGRHMRLSPLNAIRKISSDLAASRFWRITGCLGMLTALIMLSFQSIIAGWSLSYASTIASGSFSNMPLDQLSGEFAKLTSSGLRQISWHVITILAVMAIAARGIHKGLEIWLQMLMPLLWTLLILLLSYSILKSTNFKHAINIMFTLEFSKITFATIVTAIGQAFITLSLGMCCIMAYGAYMPSNTSIPRTASNVIILTVIMTLASFLIIFPITQSQELPLVAGQDALFIFMTTAFMQMPMGETFGFLFFLLIGTTILCSALALLEPALSWLTEKTRFGRCTSTVILCVIVWFLGLVIILNNRGDLVFTFYDQNLFVFINDLTSKYMLPIGGIMLSIFSGWIVKRSAMMKELGLSVGVFNLWRAMVRVVVPLSLMIVLFYSFF